MRPPSPPPGPWQLFRIWATVGFQSFGGGSSAQFLIQRAFIEQHGWLTAEEYLHLWGLCILTPGINMIALTVLIGRKLGGARGSSPRSRACSCRVRRLPACWRRSFSISLALRRSGPSCAASCPLPAA